jgi:hypothetical protein
MFARLRKIETLQLISFQSTTLDQTGQPLSSVFHEGSWVVFNATLINSVAKIPYLATAVWQKKDQANNHQIRA